MTHDASARNGCVVCAQNNFKRKGAKPILQATVPKIDACSRDEKV
jgi:hypothetical protein